MISFNVGSIFISIQLEFARGTLVNLLDVLPSSCRQRQPSKCLTIICLTFSCFKVAPFNSSRERPVFPRHLDSLTKLPYTSVKSLNDIIDVLRWRQLSFHKWRSGPRFPPPFSTRLAWYRVNQGQQPILLSTKCSQQNTRIMGGITMCTGEVIEDWSTDRELCGCVLIRIFVTLQRKWYLPTTCWKINSFSRHSLSPFFTPG